MYATDRGLDRLDSVRGHDQVTLAWLAAQLRTYVDLHPEHENALDRFAGWLASLDEEE